MLPSIPHCLKVLILMYNIYQKIKKDIEMQASRSVHVKSDLPRVKSIHIMLTLYFNKYLKIKLFNNIR